jgi:hypothetical protein
MDQVMLVTQALGYYLAVGLLFGLVFVTVMIGRVDPAAAGSSWRFRLLVLPGVAALWPLLAMRWTARGELRTARRLRAVHVVLWLVLGPLALFLLWEAIEHRPPAPLSAAADTAHGESAGGGADR